MKIRDLHLTELTPIKLVKYITKKASQRVERKSPIMYGKL